MSVTVHPSEKAIPVVDCDVDPKVSSDHKIYRHQKGGQLMLSSEKIVLYRPPFIQDQRKTRLFDLYEDLRRKRQNLPNACILDYWLKKPGSICGEFEKLKEGNPRSNTARLFLFGTIYSNKEDEQYVRYLYRDCCGINSFYCWLGRELDGGDYIALFSND